MNLAPRTVSAETFTVIHGGAEIDERTMGELLDAASAWAAAAERGVTRVVQVWGPPWRRVLASCAAMSAGGGGPLCVLPLPGAENLVAGVKARGMAVQYRQARQSVVDNAELRAISQGWPVRYI